MIRIMEEVNSKGKIDESNNREREKRRKGKREERKKEGKTEGKNGGRKNGGREGQKNGIIEDGKDKRTQRKAITADKNNGGRE